MEYTLEDMGYNRILTKGDVLASISKRLAHSIEQTLPHGFSDKVKPSQITSGGFVGNLNIVQGYMKSVNFQSGVNGWKFDAVGNLEANSGTFRGSIFATTGNIGDWVIDTNGIYYDGTGTPSIRTAQSVGSGSNGVLMDANGIKVYDDVLGVVVNLPSDGSAPSFASGTINETTFEISTNAVLRTSSTVGDGTANSAGVLINNSGLYACEANQTLGNANVRITALGDGYFSGTVNAATINSSEINSSDINGAIITGGLFRTAESGRRLEIDSMGVTFYNGGAGATYGDNSYTYNDSSRAYGTGVLGYFNNSQVEVPLYFNAEQAVADIHLFNRSSNPSGDAEIGDLAVVDGFLKVYTDSTGVPGWRALAFRDESSASPSISPSTSPSISPSASPS